MLRDILEVVSSRRLLPLWPHTLVWLLALWQLCLPLWGQPQQPELVPQTGHAMPITALALRPDGRVASAGLDGSVKLWSSDGRVLASFPFRDSPIALSFAGSGGESLVLVTETESGRDVRVWRVAEATEVTRFALTGKGPVAVAGDRLVAAQGGEVALHELPGGREIGRRLLFECQSGEAPTITELAFHTSGSLAAVSQQRVLWGPWGQPVQVAAGLDVRALALSPDGERLAIGTHDELRVFDPKGKLLATRPSGGQPHGLAWIEAGWLAWSDSYGGPLIVWSPSSGQTHGGPEQPRSVATLAAAGGLVATASPWGGQQSGGILLWSLDGQQRELVGAGEALGSVTYLRQADLLLSLSLGNAMHVWDLRRGRLAHTVRFAQDIDSHPQMIAQPEGSLAAWVGRRELVLTDLNSGEKLWSLPFQVPATGRAYRAVCFHPDGQSLYVFTPERAAQYSLEGQRLGEWPSPVRSPLFAAASPANREIAICADDGARLLSLETGEYRRLDSVRKAASAIYSSRGTLALRSGTGELFLVDKDVERKVATGSFIWSAAFSLDGDWLAVGQTDGTIRLLPASGEGQGRSFPAHQGTVTGVSFMQGQLASSGIDGTVRLWSLTEHGQGLTLIPFRSGVDWLVTNPSGYFDGSELGQKAVDWRMGNRWYRVDQFFDQFFRPGLLALYLAGQGPAASAAAISQLPQPPEVTILSPQAGTRVKGTSVKVELEVKDLGGGISDLRVFHNGHRLSLAGDAVRALEVPLVDGLNTLQATAFSADGKVESAGDKVRIFCSGPEPDDAVLYLLSIGIDDYPEGRALSYAGKDARAVARALRSELYPKTKSTLLLDRQATQAGIVKALEEVAAGARPQDTLIVYMAGHGVKAGEDFVFLPVDGSFGSATGAPPRGLRWTELAGLLRQVPATRQLIVLDTCNSGAATALSEAALEWIRASQTLARDSGCYLVAAARAEQSALEAETLGHGLLTFAILEAVGDAAPAKAPVSDGVITAGGLVYYLSSSVPRLARQHGGGLKQDVLQFSTGMDFPVVKAQL